MSDGKQVLHLLAEQCPGELSAYAINFFAHNCTSCWPISKVHSKQNLAVNL